MKAPVGLWRVAPQAELGMVWVAGQEPRELFPRLVERQRAFGEIAADLRVAVERVEVIEVGRHQAPHQQAFGLEDLHAAS
jgi:hypothetical protein